ncbi:TPA: hypothetical protein PXE99_000405 [Mannheimia haemolytica]|nr:hypothetical protein [Mannheimia haemolytica]
MKNSYKGFYNPTEDELKEAWESEHTVFIFDTNVLLNIYSYKEKTRSDFFLSLETLKKKIWLPFHVGLEYQMRRLDIVRQEKSIFREANKKLDDLKDFRKALNKLEERFPELVEAGKKLEKEITLSIKKYKKKIEKIDKNQPCVRSHDNIREKLNTLFQNRIGKEPDQDTIHSIEKEGETRYEDKIPPGYKDKDKGDEYFQYGSVKYKKKYGDLIIWKQILEHVKEVSCINNVILVTDDVKSDWWFQIDSGGNKIIGPHALLINEIKEIENIKLFHMYTTSDFLSATNEYNSGINISKDSIDETKELESKNIDKDRFNMNSSIMNGIETMQTLERMNALSSLNEFERMRELSGINELERIRKLSGINELERIRKLSGIDEFERIEKMISDELKRRKIISDELKRRKIISDELKRRKIISDELERVREISNQLESGAKIARKLERLEEDEEDNN